MSQSGISTLSGRFSTHTVASILQSDVGHRRQKHESPGSPPGPPPAPRLGICFVKRRGLKTWKRTHHHGHWNPLDRLRRVPGILQSGYDLSRRLINHHSMSPDGTDRFDSTSIARLRAGAPGIRPRSRKGSAPKSSGAAVDIAQSVAISMFYDV